MCLIKVEGYTRRSAKQLPVRYFASQIRITKLGTRALPRMAHAKTRQEDGSLEKAPRPSTTIFRLKFITACRISNSANRELDTTKEEC